MFRVILLNNLNDIFILSSSGSVSIKCQSCHLHFCHVDWPLYQDLWTCLLGESVVGYIAVISRLCRGCIADVGVIMVMLRLS